MSKRKILSLAMALSIVAIMAVGATLAYFTDTDSADNVFTVGNVDITLHEVFPSESNQPVVMVPSVGSAQNDTLKNGITKEVTVSNDGTEEAYVRVHIAIPTLLDDGDPTYDASKNILHFNYDKESIGAGLWDWSKAADDNKYEGDWNAYKTTIDQIEYNVYVVTYGSILAKNEVTAQKAMSQVYLDNKTTNEDIEYYNGVLGENWEIKVVAEGAQADGFTNAYDALNTAFGAPTAAANPWNNYGK